MSTLVHKNQSSQSEFLEAVYVQLNYRDGALLDTVDTSQVPTVDANEWLEKGNWLELGKKINAEKIFFVNNDPVIVFRAFDSPPSESEISTAFRQAWCMTRSQYLFLALPGELRVYGLRQSPPQSEKDPDQQLTCKTIKKIADVSVELEAYRREQLEAGYFPQDEHFGEADKQADKRLINDLKQVRKRLREINELKLEFAHALIGRSIFVRYLEDREILHPAYFEQVAAKHQRDDWLALLDQSPPRRLIQDEKWRERRYYQVLQDKDFTYALFEQLAQDFNGDLFPKDEAEKEAVTSEHLEALRKFLLGDTDPNQPTLWLWAYDFEIVPIELISSIYEEFYKNEQDDSGTHYTPSVLVEFVLSQVLPKSYLEANPTLQILDPACGSGIFLVEAYRRLVRYRIQKQGRPLNSVELREILRDQIRGIEINEHAAYVAAFSLYLALLHYQVPRNIRAQIELPQPDDKPLPHLIYNANQVGLPNQYGVLFNCNAFALTKAERAQLQAELKAHPSRTTLKNFLDTSDNLPIEANSVDVIVGNPPWGFVRKNKATPEITEAQEKAKEWCQRLGWSIGNNELSQAFIARSFGLLTTNGACGLLISTGVFWKGQNKSQQFRQRWLQQCTIKTVTNFAHVRHVFFEKAVSPFAVVHYVFQNASSGHYIQYWSAKRTKIIENKPRVILHLSDLKRVRQVEIQNNERLWKTHWWGNHRDASLIRVLQLEKNIVQLSLEHEWPIPKRGSGFQKASSKAKGKPSNWLKDYQFLPAEFFQRYGLIDDAAFQKEDAPDFANRPGEPDNYQGWRLLVGRGISQDNVNGQIEARLENKSFCFPSSIYILTKLDKAEDWERKSLLGILWSKLIKYYLFMISGSWVVWHTEIRLWQLKQLPIRLPDNLELRNRIVTIVDKLRNRDTGPRTLFNLANQPNETETIASLERQLDEAIFDLYELNEAERDLVLDMCETGLDFFYRESNSNAVKRLEPYPQAKQGFITDLPQRREAEKGAGLEGYLYVFLDMWKSYLEPEGVFRWRVVRPDNDPMVAVVFSTQSKHDDLPPLQDDKAMWADLKRIAKSSDRQINHRIYIAGLVRLVTDDAIIIIKRNERRLWTRSQAREDAEATFLQAMRSQESQLELA